jgi:hypothetical protein
MPNLEYLTNSEGQPIAVVIPIELWRKLLPPEDTSLEALSDEIEDYCLNKAMDEGKQSPLYDLSTALAELEE